VPSADGKPTTAKTSVETKPAALVTIPSVGAKTSAQSVVKPASETSGKPQVKPALAPQIAPSKAAPAKPAAAVKPAMVQPTS
jgi:hypothetical protein